MRFDLGPDLAALKIAALARVDVAAEAARMAFLTTGAGQAMEYQATEAEGRAYVNALSAGQSPDLANYPFIKAEYDAMTEAAGTPPDVMDVVYMVVGMANLWIMAGAEIKRLRRAAKLAIESATTPTQIRAAQQITWPTPP